MGQIWSEESKFQAWLEVEITVMQAKENLSLIRKGFAEKIKKKAKIDIPVIKKIEEKTKHDLESFVISVKRQITKAQAVHLHAGMTSYDVEDTAFGLLFKRSLKILERDIIELLAVIRGLMLAHRYTLQIGRTHGIQAEPITFGIKLANWFDEMERNLARIQRLKDLMVVGKISGAVGNYANISREIEEETCRLLGLKPVRIATQIISRDRHAEYVCQLAIIAGSLAKFATEIRNLQRTEIQEVMEIFTKGQKGSSAMPHKKNPISSESITSDARMMVGYVFPALMNQITWHERDLANSANERIILGDAAILLDYMLVRFTKTLKGLLIFPDKMKKNIGITKGLIFSQNVMLALAEKAKIAREDAHDIVQEIALEAWETRGNFKKMVLTDRRITKHLSRKEINQCFQLERYLVNVDKIFERFDL